VVWATGNRVARTGRAEPYPLTSCAGLPILPPVNGPDLICGICPLIIS